MQKSKVCELSYRSPYQKELRRAYLIDLQSEVALRDVETGIEVIDKSASRAAERLAEKVMLSTKQYLAPVRKW